MTDWQVITLVVSAVIAAIITRLCITLARRWNIVDDPAAAPERKQHQGRVPLLGGLAIILSQVIVWAWLVFIGKLGTELPVKFVYGLAIAAVLLAIGGILDDVRRRSPRQQIFWPMAAAVVTIMVGIGINFMTNPFGGLVYLDSVSIDVFSWHGNAYQFTLWADLFTFVWLLGAMYTTKLLDGLDGLVSGLGVIGALIVFCLTLRPEVQQSEVGILAMSLAGAAGGFLVFNWHPARIFLGESGSLYIGFMLGVLAIISGGKIATALLILGLPILDVVVVIVRRKFFRHVSPWRTSDRSHLHFRLLDAGLSPRQAVSVLYAVTLVFGLATLFVTGKTKLLVLAGLGLVMAGLVWWVVRKSNRVPEKNI